MDEIQKLRLSNVLDSNKAAPDERGFWTERLAESPRDIFENIIGLLENMPDEARWLYEIQKKKEAALAEGSKSAWESVIAEEYAHLQTILNNAK